MLLNYNDVGPGPVVVLLHGFPLDNSMWEFQNGSIGSEYRVITPDLRGHGKTAAPEGTYTIDVMADDVLELVDALGIGEPFVLGGLSMGGYIALSLAVRYPNRLRGLILMDTKPGADSPDAARGREDFARQIEQSGSTEPVVAAMLPKMLSPHVGERRPEILARVADMMKRAPARGVVGSLRGLATRPDRTADLAAIAVPTLVIVGAEDQITPPSEARAMVDRLPNARLVEVPNAGHLSPLENPAPVNSAIFEFLAGLE